MSSGRVSAADSSVGGACRLFFKHENYNSTTLAAETNKAVNISTAKLRLDGDQKVKELYVGGGVLLLVR